jgi:hypothetical protein
LIAYALEPGGTRMNRSVQRLWHRRTWNTNRGVILALADGTDLAELVAQLRREAYACRGRSPRMILGLQVVLAIETGRLPTERELRACLDASTTADEVLRHAIMVQSIFAAAPSSGECSSARSPSWFARMVDGRLHGAIAQGIGESMRGS